MHLLKLEDNKALMPGAHRKVMLGLPCHGGMLPAEVAISIYHECLLAIYNGIAVYPVFYPRCSLVTLARNHLFSEFYSSDYDDLVFWDVDQSCASGDLTRLLTHAVDIVGGVARIKKDPEEYRVEYLPSEDGRIMKENGLVEMGAIGACFLRITKKAAATIISDNGHLAYKDSSPSGFSWDIFKTCVDDDRQYCGEDISFCHLARKSGLKVYLDPTLYFTHIGLHGYSGCIEDYLKRETLPENRPQLQFKTEELEKLLFNNITGVK